MARIANDPLENERANNNNKKKIKSNKNKPWNDEINNEQKTSSVERNTRKITCWKASERWIDQLLGASGLHPQCIRFASGQWNPYVGARPFLYFIYSFNFFFVFWRGGGAKKRETSSVWNAVSTSLGCEFMELWTLWRGRTSASATNGRLVNQIVLNVRNEPTITKWRDVRQHQKVKTQPNCLNVEIVKYSVL